MAKPQTRGYIINSSNYELCFRPLGQLAGVNACICCLLLCFERHPLSRSVPLRMSTLMMLLLAILFPKSVLNSTHCLLPWVWLVPWNCALETLPLSLSYSPTSLHPCSSIDHPLPKAISLSLLFHLIDYYLLLFVF